MVNNKRSEGINILFIVNENKQDFYSCISFIIYHWYDWYYVMESGYSVSCCIKIYCRYIYLYVYKYKNMLRILFQSNDGIDLYR